jgi:type II secretory pathway pseudopilin PulG
MPAGTRAARIQRAASPLQTLSDVLRQQRRARIAARISNNAPTDSSDTSDNSYDPTDTAPDVSDDASTERSTVSDPMDHDAPDTAKPLAVKEWKVVYTHTV